MFTIALSLSAALVTCLVHSYAGLSILKTAILFSGLEGTILLAFAISPPYKDMEQVPKGFFRKLIFPFVDGRGLNYPVNYNYVYFYLGLICLAISFVCTALDKT